MLSIKWKLITSIGLGITIEISVAAEVGVSVLYRFLIIFTL